jgi:hypothetical protein
MVNKYMAYMPGTGLFAPYGATIEVALTDEFRNAILIKCTAANLPTGANYAVGCIAIATDSGVLYYNTGTSTTASFTAVNAGAAALTLPTALTDATTTTGDSLSSTLSAITTGNALHLINGNTTNFTTGASLLYADIGTATAGNGLVVIGTGAYTGTGMIIATTGAMTTGVLCQLTSTTGLTSGSVLRATTSTTGAIATNGAFSFTATGAFTNGAATLGALHIGATSTVSGTIMSILGGSQTTGVGLYISEGANTGMTSGSLLRIVSASTGAIATNGVVSIQSAAAYTSTSNMGLFNITASATMAGTVSSIFANAVTTGVGLIVSGTGTYTGAGFVTVNTSGMTTGISLLVKNTAATMTTGRYISANDITNGEVFGIGLNGHIHSTAGSAPSCAVTTQQGITAATVTAGATDTCGVITTTGTQNNTSDSTLTVTFGKTYTTAPKTVFLTPANAAAALAGSGGAYISSITATTFVVGIAKSATTAATPSWNYFVVA